MNRKRLGNDPLSWIKDSRKNEEIEKKEEKKTNSKNRKRITLMLDVDIIDKAYKYAWWERITKSEALENLLLDGLKGKKIG